MNKHIAKLRDHLLAEEQRLVTEMSDVRAALKAIGVVGAIVRPFKQGEINPDFSSRLKERMATDPEFRANRLAGLAKGRATRTANAAARRAAKAEVQS